MLEAAQEAYKKEAEELNGKYTGSNG